MAQPLAENDDGPDGSTNSLFTRITKAGTYFIASGFGKQGWIFKLKVTRLQPV